LFSLGHARIAIEGNAARQTSGARANTWCILNAQHAIRYANSCAALLAIRGRRCAAQAKRKDGVPHLTLPKKQGGTVWRIEIR
jgi:hypothetical protein